MNDKNRFNLMIKTLAVETFVCLAGILILMGIALYALESII